MTLRPLVLVPIVLPPLSPHPWFVPSLPLARSPHPSPPSTPFPPPFLAPHHQVHPAPDREPHPLRCHLHGREYHQHLQQLLPLGSLGAGQEHVPPHTGGCLVHIHHDADSDFGGGLRGGDSGTGRHPDRLHRHPIPGFMLVHPLLYCEWTLSRCMVGWGWGQKRCMDGWVGREDWVFDRTHFGEMVGLHMRRARGVLTVEHPLQKKPGTTTHT